MPSGHLDPELGRGVVGVVGVSAERFDTDGCGLDFDEDIGGLGRRSGITEGDKSKIAKCAIEAIALEAGVTRPVVYGVFDGLGDLLTTLLDRQQMRAMEQLAPLLVANSAPARSKTSVFSTWSVRWRRR